MPYGVMTGGFDAVVAPWPPTRRPSHCPRWHHRARPLRARRGGSTTTLRSTAGAAWLASAPAAAPADTYRATDRGLATSVHDGVGIIRHPVDVALTPSLLLRWSWRIDELPSILPEDTTLTHDYLSVAIEFDDGHDLTWHWSCSLPEGFAYRWPFDHWRRRETHLVVRSGSVNLGLWVGEKRPVLAKHHAAIGGDPPPRIVAVWLISCNFLEGREGRAEFAHIEPIDSNKAVSDRIPQPSRIGEGSEAAGELCLT